LSDPFLGRCNFHHIAFPDPEMMQEIIRVHFPDINSNLMESAVSTFYEMRKIDAIEKKPATRELINWIRALKTDLDFNPDLLTNRDIPFLGVLFKKSQDYQKALGFTNQRG
jgi:MoxR-like ATPase